MNSDILVIGGGIAGVSAAASLSDSASVTLLEGESALGYHASGRSAAMFLENYGNATVVALNRASAPHHHAAKVLSPRGIMAVAMAAEEDAFRHDLAALSMQEIPLSDARARVPILDPSLRFAAFNAEAVDLDTDKLLQSYAKIARQNGATIVTGASVTEIRKTAQGWTVTTQNGSYTASILVNAAGAWADQTAAMAGVSPIGLQPYRRSIARLPAPGGHDVTTWPMLLAPNERWYAKPDAGAWLVSPAEEDPMDPHDAWADDMVLAEGIARYQDYVTEPVTRMLSNWAGLRTFAPDRALVIGPDPQHPGFFWLAGQGGYGFQTAPAASVLVADLICDRSPVLDRQTVASLCPSRF